MTSPPRTLLTMARKISFGEVVRLIEEAATVDV
jgi:hypothetical protein